MTTTKLTVAIPTFNRANMLQQSVGHLIEVLPPEVEILIVDNGSTDRTKNVCDGLPKREHLSVYHNRENVGAARNNFLCFLYAKSEYIMLLGDDDKLDANYVKKVLGIISNDEFGFITYQEEARSDVKVDVVKAGGDGVAHVFMRSGTLAGNVFNRNFFSLNFYPPLHQCIYPQVATAMECALKEKVAVVHIHKVVDVDFYNNLSIVDKAKDRPGDFGIGERLSYALLLRNENKIAQDVYLSCASSLMTWAGSIWQFKNNYDPRLASAFVSELLKNHDLIVTPGFFHFLRNLSVNHFRKMGWIILYSLRLLHCFLIILAQRALNAKN